jgi:hypothetical protein
MVLVTRESSLNGMAGSVKLHGAIAVVVIPDQHPLGVITRSQIAHVKDLAAWHAANAYAGPMCVLNSHLHCAGPRPPQHLATSDLPHPIFARSTRRRISGGHEGLLPTNSLGG